MALDPQMLPYVEVEPRVGRSLADNEPGIGLGSPQYFRFAQGMSLMAPPWHFTQSNPHDSSLFQAHEGFMRCTIEAHQHDVGWISESIIAPFANTEGSVSIGFRVRVNSLQGSPVQLSLAAGVIILINPDGTATYTVGGPSQPVLAPSAIKADGQWRDILISVTPNEVAVWEGEQQKFVQAFAAGASIAVQFTAIATDTRSTLATVFDISDVVVVSGTDKHVRPSRGLLDSIAPAQAEAVAMMTAVQAQLAGLQEAATPLAQALHSMNISWSDWFWGRDVDPALQQAVNAFVEHPKTRAFVEATEDYRRNVPSSPLSPTLTLCLSVGMTITAVVAVGTTVGLNIDLGRGSAQLVVSASGGIGTNISVGFGLEVLFFGRGLSEALGWFFYTKVSGGEFVNAAIGLAGGIPVEEPVPGVSAGNVGLALGIGIGAGVFPIEVDGGLSYSWALS